LGKEREMPVKIVLDKLSIYIPQRKQGQNPVERLIELGKKRDRSVNYIVVEAILEYLEREEKGDQ
jgi:predicted DNA-binding protein